MAQYSMELLNIALRLFTVSQLLLLGVLIAQSKNPIRVRVLTVTLALAVISYLILGTVKRNPELLEHFYLLWFPANITPSLLLLLVWFTFEEKCNVPIWLKCVLAFGVSSSLWFYLNGTAFCNLTTWLPVSKVLIAFVAIVVVWSGKDNDLIEVRCKIRDYSVFGIGLIIAISYLVKVATDFNNPVFVDLVEAFILFVFTFMCNYFLIQLYPNMQLMLEKPVIKEESEDKLVIELLERMVSERLYTDHDLRVASLAIMFNIPEYKLRKKINQQLGYRNFNQFVNHYRIEEAGAKLLEDKRLPVLSIALDVGFRSISSFNTAFQAKFGVSPTQYRQQQGITA